RGLRVQGRLRTLRERPRPVAGARCRSQRFFKAPGLLLLSCLKLAGHRETPNSKSQTPNPRSSQIRIDGSYKSVKPCVERLDAPGRDLNPQSIDCSSLYASPVGYEPSASVQSPKSKVQSPNTKVQSPQSTRRPDSTPP